VWLLEKDMSMSAHDCCQTKTLADDKVHRPASRWGRGGEIAGWIVPSAALVLLPKCPACVAAYVALATGIGISLPTAAYLRVAMMVVCVAALVFIAVRRWRIFNKYRNTICPR
jgi:Flp pilus assembly protein TadB